MKIKLDKKGFNVGTEIKNSYNKIITKFGTGAKIDCSKEYLGKDVIIIIHKKEKPIKKEIESLYSKKVTKFGTGAKIDCSKEYIGKEATILILKEK